MRYWIMKVVGLYFDFVASILTLTYCVILQGKTIHVFARLGCFRLPVVSDLDTEITADTFENYLSAANMEREGESQSEM